MVEEKTREPKSGGDSSSHFGPLDLHLFSEGRHTRLYERLGAQITVERGASGVRFSVWAPNAQRVGVIGDFNDWQPAWLEPLDNGVWTGFIAGVTPGATYKFRVESRLNDYRVDKADPLAARARLSPDTSSQVWDLDYTWQDGEWMDRRKDVQALNAPMSIYEVHLGSWMRSPTDPAQLLSYRELAPKLVEHVQRTGFTHVELMPVSEHPFYGSWGYQVSGYFAPTARYGTPQDFKYLVDTLHRAGIGVLVDWVPAHFPTDEHALIYFDGTHLYEHADPRQGMHPEWGSAVFNYGRNEVRSFLLSSANVWLDRYHVDGLRVDAVASMLYLDYSRRAGEWIPNVHGGNENLEAIEFLKFCNSELYSQHPDIQIIAEESTAWPGVSRPVYTGGLGFGLKWDMGWMHDTLQYFACDPLYRVHHHQQLTFRAMYAQSENFVLALSHDEVVHGKRSLLAKMPGDDWQQFANLRLLYAYMWSLPGKKLLFMGGEFGQRKEWNHEQSLDWHLVEHETHHSKLQLLVGELNRLYRSVPALHEWDARPGGFEWVDANDAPNSVISYLRNASDGGQILVVLNFTPVVQRNYRVGVSREGVWQELLNTDAVAFGGSGQGNSGGVEASPLSRHGRPFSLSLTLPPLGALFLRAPGR